MGFNLVFKYGDIVTTIWFASFAANMLPYAISHLVSFKKKIQNKRNLLKFLCTFGFCLCPFHTLFCVYIYNTYLAFFILLQGKRE
jgi:hypothetical protein